MTAFTPYFDQNINEHIQTPEEAERVRYIRDLDVDALDDFRLDLNTDAQIDPSVKQTRLFKISCKTVIRCIQKFRHLGQRPTKMVGPPPTIAQVIEAGMLGVIIGDEFAKRIKS